MTCNFLDKLSNKFKSLNWNSHWSKLRSELVHLKLTVNRIFLYIYFPVQPKWDNKLVQAMKVVQILLAPLVNIIILCCEHNNIKLSDRSYARANAFNSWGQYSSSIVGNINLKEWTHACRYKVIVQYKRNFLL